MRILDVGFDDPAEHPAFEQVLEVILEHFTDMIESYRWNGRSLVFRFAVRLGRPVTFGIRTGETGSPVMYELAEKHHSFFASVSDALDEWSGADHHRIDLQTETDGGWRLTLSVDAAEIEREDHDRLVGRQVTRRRQWFQEFLGTRSRDPRWRTCENCLNSELISRLPVDSVPGPVRWSTSVRRRSCGSVNRSATRTARIPGNEFTSRRCWTRRIRVSKRSIRAGFPGRFRDRTGWVTWIPRSWTRSLRRPSDASPSSAGERHGTRHLRYASGVPETDPVVTATPGLPAPGKSTRTGVLASEGTVRINVRSTLESVLCSRNFQ